MNSNIVIYFCTIYREAKLQYRPALLRCTWVYSGVHECTWVYSGVHECTAVYSSVHGYTAVYASYNTLNAPVAMGYTLRKLCTQSDISLLSFSFSDRSYHTLQCSKIQLFS